MRKDSGCESDEVPLHLIERKRPGPVGLLPHKEPVREEHLKSVFEQIRIYLNTLCLKLASGKLNAASLLVILAAVAGMGSTMTSAFIGGVIDQGQAPEHPDRIQGTWQGTVREPGTTLRAVLKISRTPSGEMNVTFYSIDQGGQPIPVSPVSFDGGILKCVIQNFALSYDGKISSDGNSITGTLRQEAKSFPLVLVRATPETEWTIPAPPPKIRPMAADAQPGIEVATIKPTSPNPRRSGMTFRGREIVVDAYTVDDIVKVAYDLQDKQLVRAPEWMSSEKFDVIAQPDQPGIPNREQIQIALKKLLADRFAFRFHDEQKEMSAYILTVAKDGPKMTKTTDTSESGGMSIGPLGLVRARNLTMSEFGARLQAMVLDRPVVNRTELDGRWDFSLKWMPDESQFGGQLKLPPPDDAAQALPPLFIAIQQQMGLKMDAQRTMVRVLVIDHVEHPSPN